MAADKVVLAGEVNVARVGSGSFAFGKAAVVFLGEEARSVFLGEDARSVLACFREGEVGSGLGRLFEDVLGCAVVVKAVIVGVGVVGVAGVVALDASIKTATIFFQQKITVVAMKKSVR